MRKVFISYSRLDKDIVLAIKDEIERIPGAKCWMDLNNIESGNPTFDAAIVKGIEESRVFLFMLSDHSQKSDWAISELNLALRIANESNGGLNVVMVNINGCEMNNVFYLRYNRMDIIDWNNKDLKDKLLRDISEWIQIDDHSDNTPNLIGTGNTSYGIEEILKKAKEMYGYENFAKAFELYMDAAKRGNALAQSKVAYMYYMGIGIGQDDQEAYNWCSLAAKQDYSPAQNFLGRMYLHGRGVKQDYEEAMNWCRLVANKGYVKAQIMLGDLFLKGKDDMIPQDYKKAFHWYKEAASQGSSEGQYKMGNMYYHGQGVDQDYVEAVVWFRKAAEKNNPDALVALGYMYLKGIGVSVNLSDSAKYYGRAIEIFQESADHGDKRALKQLEKLKKRHVS